jgi:hypothetical protein
VKGYALVVYPLATRRIAILKVGMVGKVRFEARIKELVENLPDLAAGIDTFNPPLLRTSRHGPRTGRAALGA